MRPVAISFGAFRKQSILTIAESRIPGSIPKCALKSAQRSAGSCRLPTLVRDQGSSLFPSCGINTAPVVPLAELTIALDAPTKAVATLIHRGESDDLTLD